jgi:predicted RNA-binding protein YlqC (UPF0109 family)
VIILDLKHPLDIGRVKRGKMISAITSILGSVGGLATSYIDGKTAIQKAEAQIRMKEATGLLLLEPHRVHGKTNG